MNIGKKFDRAFQWAGEKMGSEAKTSFSEDFKSLETEMALRFDGMHDRNTSTRLAREQDRDQDQAGRPC